jgi:hypothetical protein
MATLLYSATIFEWLSSPDQNYLCNVIIQGTSYIVSKGESGGAILFWKDAKYHLWNLVAFADDNKMTIKKNQVHATFSYSFLEVQDIPALKQKIQAAVYPNGNITMLPSEGLRF